MENSILCNFRWEGNNLHTELLPAIPRSGDKVKIYDNKDDEIIIGIVHKVVFFVNEDTRHKGDPSIDVYVQETVI